MCISFIRPKIRARIAEMLARAAVTGNEENLLAPAPLYVLWKCKVFAEPLPFSTLPQARLLRTPEGGACASYLLLKTMS